MTKMKNLVQKAERYATRYHLGQYRKCGSIPYIVHPAEVVELLRQHGFDDEKTLAIAWLHDTLEDTVLSYGEIYKEFGHEVADGVYLLTRNVNRNDYRKRLSVSPEYIKIIKIMDTYHNIRSIDELDKIGKQRKINDCLEFYIPMAKKLVPDVAEEMKCCLKKSTK